MKFSAFKGYIALYLLVLGGQACQDKPTSSTQEDPSSSQAAATPVAQLGFTVDARYPHDTSAFTQGLLIYDGKLYESTGGTAAVNGYQSWVGTIDLASGKATKKVPLNAAWFGEGITVLNDKLYQLTWQDKKALRYDAKTLKLEKTFDIQTDGWGLTQNGKSLILSDGSSNLYFLNPETFSTEKILGVTLQGQPIGNLNELEYHNGYIYANKWQSNDILKINAENGQIEAVADMRPLLQAFGPEYAQQEKYNNGEGVLNGIAFDPTKQKWLITGKLWPYIFEVSFK